MILIHLITGTKNREAYIIGEQTIADAIMDRLIHNAHRLELKGESLRKKQQNKTVEQHELIN